jgi:hypothetical protein
MRQVFKSSAGWRLRAPAYRRTHLNRALNALADELAFALDESPDRLREQITAAAAVPGCDHDPERDVDPE